MNTNQEYKNRARQEVNKKIIKDNLEVILSSFFAFLAAIFGAVIASGFDFSIETFKNPAFYISTLINFGIMMFVFTFFKKVTINRLKARKESKYAENKEREARLIKAVRDGNLEDNVERAALIETENNRKAAAQQLIDNITYGLYLEDIEDLDNEKNIAINQEEFDKFVTKRGFNNKAIKKLRKAINNVLQGKYQYDIITAHDVLVDTNLDPTHSRKVKIDEKELDKKESIKKALTFIVSTAITNSLVWGGINDKFWVSLLTQSMLILTSAISAVLTAHNRISTLTLVSENKCDFLNTAIKMQVKKPPVVIENKQPITNEEKDNLLTEGVSHNDVNNPLGI